MCLAFLSYSTWAHTHSQNGVEENAVIDDENYTWISFAKENENVFERAPLHSAVFVTQVRLGHRQIDNDPTDMKQMLVHTIKTLYPKLFHGHIVDNDCQHRVYVLTPSRCIVCSTGPSHSFRLVFGSLPSTHRGDVIRLHFPRRATFARASRQKHLLVDVVRSRAPELAYWTLQLSKCITARN